MTTLVQSTVALEQRIILYGVSWPTYDQLSRAFEPHPSVRLTYDQGALEIMVTSFGHEKLKKIIGSIVELIAAEMEIDYISAGQTTLRLETLQKGFEGDDSFFFTRHFST